MKIYLIRHGRQCSKLCNVNVDLSQEGFRQAALLGERLVKKKIDKVYSSGQFRQHRQPICTGMWSMRSIRG